MYPQLTNPSSKGEQPDHGPWITDAFLQFLYEPNEPFLLAVARSM